MIRPVVIVFLSISLFTSLAVAQNQPALQHHEADKKNQYEKSMEERFRRLGKSLDELHALAAARAEQVRKEAARSLGDAEQKRKEAGRKLEEMRTEGRKKWTILTEEMNDAMDEFEKAYERAKAYFKE